jgi:hypothetical protein
MLKWLMKRGNEKHVADQVVLRRGGENVSETPCLKQEVMEDCFCIPFPPPPPYVDGSLGGGGGEARLYTICIHPHV